MVHADKNLENTVQDLEQSAVNAHDANQQEQRENDRRKDMLSKEKAIKANENSAYE